MTTRSRIALAMSVAAIAFGLLSPVAFAAEMKKDTMSKESAAKDSMKKKDTMSKDSMKKEDTMSKDHMKKDDGMMKKN